MYAIIADSGKQFKVTEGQELRVDYRDLPKGEKVEFERVLAYSSEGDVRFGHPTIDGATVSGEVLGLEQGEKLTVQKFRRRKNSRRKTGHRQTYTRIMINKINMPSA